MEKPQASATATPVDEINKRSAKTNVQEELPPENIIAPNWKPGYLAQFPYLAFLSLLAVLVCSVASVIVLVLSNNVSQTKWNKNIAPNVVLSILNAIANITLAVALSRGIAIAWWRKAMKGATVEQLHNSWAFSINFSSILGNFWSLDVIAIATLATKLALIDGILFQKATLTYTAPDPPRQVSLLGAAATEFPSTGFVVSNQSFSAQTSCSCYMIGDTYTPVVDTWETSNGFWKGYNEYFHPCEGICFTSIDAIGFEIDCQRNVKHDDIAEPAVAAWKASNGTATNASQWTDLPIFNSSFGMQYPDDQRNYSQLLLNLEYFQSDNPSDPNSYSCPGRVYTTTCTLRPAVIRYPIEITNFTNIHINNGVNLGTFSGDNYSPDAFTTGGIPAYDASVKQAEGYTVRKYLYPSEQQLVNTSTALGGIANALSQFMSSTASITYQGDALWALRQQGTLAQTMMYGPPNMGSCDCSFKSQSLDTIIYQINQLTFLTSTGLIDKSTFTGTSNLKIGSKATITGVSGNTSTSVRELGNSILIADVIHYQTHFLYVWLALAFTLLCIILIIPIFWRYGELGRDVTMGPVEIAWAFRAPMLTKDKPQSRDSVANLDDVIKEVGHKKVMYGFVHQNQPIGENEAVRPNVTLAMEEPKRVRPASGVWSNPTSPRLT